MQAEEVVEEVDVVDEVVVGLVEESGADVVIGEDVVELMTEPVVVAAVTADVVKVDAAAEVDGRPLLVLLPVLPDPLESGPGHDVQL